MNEAVKRLLIVVDGRYPSTGGAEMQARLLARSFSAAGHDVQVMAPMLERGKRRFEMLDGVSLERIPYPKVRLLGAVVLCLRFGRALLANRRRFDSIHVHMAKNLAATAGLLRPWLRASVTVKISGAWEFDRGILDVGLRDRPLNRLYNALVQRADCIQCVSEYTRQRVLEAGYSPSRVQLIPNAVDTARFKPRTAALDGMPTVVFVGRLVPVKGIPVLLEAWRGLPAGNRARLVIAGDGPERERLIALAQRLGIAETVEFLGEVTDVPKVLASASVYVQPSYLEGLSNSVLEAMAAGLPVVATRISGNEDLIDDGSNGVLVPPDDAAALTRALAQLLADPDLARRMGDHSRSLIEQGYAAPAVMKRLLAAYGCGPEAGMVIECVSDITRFKALQPQWEALAEVAVRASIFTGWDWQFHWWMSYGAEQQLRVLVAWVDGKMVGVAPLYMQIHNVARGAIKVRILRPVGTGGDTAPDDLDPLLHPGFEVSAANRLAACALDSAGDWDVMMMSDLADDSKFGKALHEAARARGIASTDSTSASIQCVTLPGRWEDFLETLTSKRRSAMRYARKRFQSLAGARFFAWSDPKTLDTAIDRLIEMHHERWKGRGESHAFSSTQYIEFHRRMMHACLAAGTLRLYCLQVQDRIIAMYYCYRHRQGIYHFQSGFDTAYASYSPGSVLLSLVLEDAILEGNRVFDMLRGEYQHKTRWGTGLRTTHCVTVYRRSVPALAYRLRREQLPQLRSFLTRIAAPGRTSNR